MADVVGRLGSVEFSVLAGTFQTLRRATSWDLDRAKPIDGLGVVTWRGKAQDQITISGVTFPGYTGGLDAVSRLRDLGDSGEAHSLVDGEGFVYGDWFVQSVEEEQSRHEGVGKPRRISYSVTLIQQPEGVS